MFESAANRIVPVPERVGRPVPKVTDQEETVVELPLTWPPDDGWTKLFKKKLLVNKPWHTGWVDVYTDICADGEVRSYVAFRLDKSEAVIQAIEAIDKLIAATSADWTAEPQVAEAIARQDRIDRLQTYLDRTVAES